MVQIYNPNACFNAHFVFPSREKESDVLMFRASWLRPQGHVHQVHHLYPLWACHAANLTRKPMCVVPNISKAR